ncbi:MAG: hypothetical protein H0W58_15320 [Acidobacteria bacterium]|jgi:hypothetical protein|nr:hypothetical protein [Acidobacteriota bacterium]
MKIKVRKVFVLAAVLLLVSVLSGCGIVDGIFNNVSSLVGLNETGTVIAKTAQIRSSYAVVAADLLEVKRGETLDILDETNFEKVHWYRVRAHDEDNTEGWIEAQNIILSDALEKSKKLAEEDRDIPAQATGQLRAASNLRLSPEQIDDNILFKLDNNSLDNNSNFEITDWKFVPKAQDAPDVDDAPKGDQKPIKGKTKNAEIEAAKENNEPDKMEDAYDVWYKVRLDPSVSPAPAGWLFGRQVELQMPSDIMFYQQNNKKFVAWQRLDNNADLFDKTSDKDTVKVLKPGSWVILSRSNLVKAKNDDVEPDFDGIQVIAYDKYNEQHYAAYRSGEVWGILPLRVEGSGDNKSFSVQLRNNNNGQMENVRFVVVKDGRSRLRITPPENMSQYAASGK